MFFTSAKVESSERLLTRARDGSHANAQARIEAGYYLENWATHLEEFAGKSDTQVGGICRNMAREYRRIVDAADLDTDKGILRGDARAIVKGKTIACQGRRRTIAVVLSAFNYGDAANPCWYIEGRDSNGDSFYWKQDYDGGHLEG